MPDVIIVNGTSILSQSVLDSCNALFLNTHCGITPKYRGVHGAYWALVNNDNENRLVNDDIETAKKVGESMLEEATKQIERIDNNLVVDEQSQGRDVGSWCKHRRRRTFEMVSAWWTRHWQVACVEAC
mgnify:CR=1 FL=1